jgi:hypothetical protein
MKVKIPIIFLFTILLLPIDVHTYSQSVVNLYTDRSEYLAGESILFKAYISDDLMNRPSSLSTLIVALIDQNGQEVASGAFPFEENHFAGNIMLSKFLSEGKYILIASPSQMKSATPDKLFSKIIEVKRTEKTEFMVDLTLKDTLYMPGNQLTANIKFTGENMNSIPSSFTYQLFATNGEIASGKGKSQEDGIATLEILLPAFNSKDNLKLLVTTSYKNKQKITGIVIPTQDNFNEIKFYESGRMAFINKDKQLNIQIKTDKPQYKRNEKVQVNLNVTDDKGDPVVATLSFSAYVAMPQSFPLQNDNMTTDAIMKNNLSGLSAILYQVISHSKEEFSQIVSSEEEIKSGSQSFFKLSLREFFAQNLSIITQLSGSSFTVQEKNDIEKIRAKKENRNQMNPNGYTADRNIFDILMQIKPYQLVNGKIIFANSGQNSFYSQNGALIVIDGISMGTDPELLKNIPVTNIAKINALTNPSDIQRYTAFNNVGVVEITTKTGANGTNPIEQMKENKSSTVFWDPDIKTDRSGKATLSFASNKSSLVIISVEGMTASGLTGSSTVQLSVK